MFGKVTYYSVDDVLRILSKAAPLKLSDEYQARYDAYDNSGIILDAGEATIGAVCCLDLTFAAVDMAKKLKYNVIITHHPAIFSPVKKLSISDRLGAGGALVYAAKNGISVISMHLNADVAEKGVDFHLFGAVKAAFGFKSISEVRSFDIYQPLSIPGTGYGRCGSFDRRFFGTVATDIVVNANVTRYEAYGDNRAYISTVCSFCGAGFDEGALKFALSRRADLIVTGEVKHHVLSAAIENGMKVLVLTHYGSENYAFEQFCKNALQNSGIKMTYVNSDEFSREIV